MKNKKTNHRPGEIFIDRYMPKATEEAREEAYANLRALVALLVRIDEHLALEEQERINPTGRRKKSGLMSVRIPGDIILERYLPTATGEEREAARENLRRLARLLIRVHERLALDNPQPSIRSIGASALESQSLPTSL